MIVPPPLNPRRCPGGWGGASIASHHQSGSARRIPAAGLLDPPGEALLRCAGSSHRRPAEAPQHFANFDHTQLPIGHDHLRDGGNHGPAWPPGSGWGKGFEKPLGKGFENQPATWGKGFGKSQGCTARAKRLGAGKRREAARKHPNRQQEDLAPPSTLISAPESK